MANRATNVGTLVMEEGNGSATLSFMHGARSSTLTARELRIAAKDMVAFADRLDAAAPAAEDPQSETRVRVRRRTR